MSKLRDTLISNCEKNFLIECLKDHNRLDGRAFEEFRDIKIEFGKDYGCCCVSLGLTKVLAQVSCEIQVPKSSRPSEGILNINIELNSIAAPNFDSSSKSDLFTQLNRTLEKCIKDSKAIDLESLCIKMNEKVWALKVDINVLNHEGNIIDCSSIAALSALCHFKRPDVTCDGEEIIIHKYSQKDPIPIVIHHYPVCVTYAVFERGDFILADPTLLEEGVADAFFTISVNGYKELCGLHLGGKAELLPHLLIKTTTKAGNRAKIIVEKIKMAVELEYNKRSKDGNVGFYNNINVVPISIEDDNVEKIDNRSHKKIVNKLDEINVPLSNKTNQSNAFGKIELKEKGTAVLIPNEYKEVEQVWGISSSEDENDPDVVEVPKQIQTVSLIDTDSEEESTIILNANKQTKKKWKK